MNTKTVQKIRPSDIDASFQYICRTCGCSHWLFMREVSAKNFFVVCDCGATIRPKRIKKITIEYDNENIPEKPKVKPKKKKQKKAKKLREPKKPEKKSKKSIDVEVFNKASGDLMRLGFTKEESETLLNKSYEIIGSDDCVALVKKAIDLVGIIDE